MPKRLSFRTSSFGIERVATMHYLYIIKSKSSDKYYIGETRNVDKRLRHHRAGKTAFGKRNTDLEIVYRHEFNNRGEAKKIESFFKKQKSHLFIDRFIAGKIDLPR